MKLLGLCKFSTKSIHVAGSPWKIISHSSA